jgi:hypothetical protein
MRPQLQAHHPVHHLPPRGQHHDRDLEAALAQLAADRKSILARQHDVEQHEVEWRRHGARHRRLPVARSTAPTRSGNQRPDRARLIIRKSNRGPSAGTPKIYVPYNRRRAPLLASPPDPR